MIWPALGGDRDVHVCAYMNKLYLHRKIAKGEVSSVIFFFCLSLHVYDVINFLLLLSFVFLFLQQ